MALSLFSRRIIHLGDLVRELVARDIKLRYRRSMLGFAWSLLNPLLQLFVFSFVFRFVIPLQIPNYMLFLFCGLLVWNWFHSSLLGATTAITDSGGLIRRPAFPSEILPFVSVSTNFVHFLLALPTLIVFVFFSGIMPTLALLLLPVVIALQFLFTLSLAYYLATIHVSFRDTQHLVTVFLLLFFYLTPIFYDASSIPERFQAVYWLNPMAHLINAYRTILLQGQVPDLLPLAIIALVSSLLLFGGYHLFLQGSFRFVEEP